MALVLSIETVDHLWRSMGPPVLNMVVPGEQALVEGINVTVPLDQVRLRGTCGAAHSDRRFVHYPNGHEFNAADPVIDGYMPIIGSRIPNLPNARNVFPLFLTLPRPLPTIPGGHWFYEAVVSNNCNLVERIFGPESAVETPPIPVKLIN